MNIYPARTSPILYQPFSILILLNTDKYTYELREAVKKIISFLGTFPNKGVGGQYS